MKKISIFLATGFYSGYFPIASGTVGTAVAVVLLYLFGGLWESIGTWNQIIFCVALTIISIPISSMAEKHFGKKDPGPIVLDEIVGYCFAMIALPITPLILILTFFVFRLFDVIKPSPAMESQQLPSGLGIVIDDVIAGIYTCLVLHLSLFLA